LSLNSFKIVGLINLITKNMILWLCHPKKIIQRKT
jgi:hypothetical protein